MKTLTPKLKKLLKLLKSLTAAEVASLNDGDAKHGDLILSLVTKLDSALLDNSTVFGLTYEEFETAKDRKILAIRMIRERLGLSLMDAKNLADDAMHKFAMHDLNRTKL